MLSSYPLSTACIVFSTKYKNWCFGKWFLSKWLLIRFVVSITMEIPFFVLLIFCLCFAYRKMFNFAFDWRNVDKNDDDDHLLNGTAPSPNADVNNKSMWRWCKTNIQICRKKMFFFSRRCYHRICELVYTEWISDFG